MVDKNNTKKSLEDLAETAEAFRDFMTNLAGEISKALADIKAPKKEDTWEMKCPYKVRDKYYIVNPRGSVKFVFWNDCDSNKKTFNQGNTFPTKKAAELESKRRNLLTRFRAFRDECNEGWKPDWNNYNSKKWTIGENEEGMYAMWTVGLNSFSVFGCFKNQFDTERAIELFGDEIKELFVDCEG